MSRDPKFSEIKDEVISSVNEQLKKKFEGKEDLEQGEGRKISNELGDEIIKELQEKFKGFKFIINVNIFKADGGINFTGMCSYNPDNDGTTTVKFGNENYNVFVGIFAFAN